MIMTHDLFKSESLSLNKVVLRMLQIYINAKDYTLK